MKRFRETRDWQNLTGMCNRIYPLTQAGPDSEPLDLTANMREGFAALIANLLKGCSRGTDAKNARFPQVAGGAAR